MIYSQMSEMYQKFKVIDGHISALILSSEKKYIINMSILVRRGLFCN